MLLKDKWLWFNGKMDEETIKEKGWSDDPFDGLKIMKNDMQIFFNADKDLQKLNAQTEYQQIQIDFLKGVWKILHGDTKQLRIQSNGESSWQVLNDLSFLLLYTTTIHF